MPGSLSKPRLSTTQPPHRAPASIRDQDTYTETLAGEALKATPVQTVAFDAKCNHKRALYRRLLRVVGTHVWAHSRAQSAGFSLSLFKKMEGKRCKATVFLTVAAFDESRRLITWNGNDPQRCPNKYRRRSIPSAEISHSL